MIFGRAQAFSGCFPAMEIPPSDQHTNLTAERNPETDLYHGKARGARQKANLKITLWLMFSQSINTPTHSTTGAGGTFVFLERRGSYVAHRGYKLSFCIKSKERKKKEIKNTTALHRELPGLCCCRENSSACCCCVPMPGCSCLCRSLSLLHFSPEHSQSRQNVLALPILHRVPWSLAGFYPPDKDQLLFYIRNPLGLQFATFPRVNQILLSRSLHVQGWICTAGTTPEQEMSCVWPPTRVAKPLGTSGASAQNTINYLAGHLIAMAACLHKNSNCLVPCWRETK